MNRRWTQIHTDEEFISWKLLIIRQVTQYPISNIQSLFPSVSICVNLWFIQYPSHGPSHFSASTTLMPLRRA